MRNSVKMYHPLVLALTLFVLFRCGSQPFVNGERTLQLVNLLYRHGDRTPVLIYPTDPHKEDTWPQGLGQLTTRGMLMHYNLGQWLRQRYIVHGFLNASYNKDALHVRSTDKDRTLMSAEADLSGLYPPTGNQIWKKGIEWMPIPVHTVPLDQDYLLSFLGPPCPKYNKLLENTKSTTEYKKVQNKYKDFLDNLTVNAGYDTPLDLISVFKVEDPLYVRSVAREIIENMRNKSTTKDPVELKKKIFMYSAHDTTLAAFLSVLGLYNGIQPPFASCVIVELWREDDGKDTVNILFRNDTTKDPYPLVLDDCSASCPLENFTKITKTMVPGDIKMECGITTPLFSNSISIIILIGVVIGLLVITSITLIGLLVFRLCRTKISHVKLQEDDPNA